MPAVEKAKKMAVMGVLAALSTVLAVMGTIISVNTLFFTAVAAFLAGVVFVRFGRGSGILFYAVCSVLDFIVNPDKMHVILYLAMAGYIVLSELSYSLLRVKNENKKERIHLVIRLGSFLLIYVPSAMLVPQMFVDRKILQETWLRPALMAAGLIGWILFDIAYGVWKRLFARYIKAV